MQTSSNAVSATDGRTATADLRSVLIRSVILLGLFAWAFQPELTTIVRTAIESTDWAYIAAMPVAVFALGYRRRHLLSAALTKGSAWGAVLLLAGVAWYAISIWPLRYGFFRLLAVVPVLAGAVLAVAGRRVLRLCLPMLLLILLSLPIGARAYAALIIKPETLTLRLARAALAALPGAAVELRGPDLYFTHGDTAGTIALGEPHRGIAMLVAYVLVGVYVVFASVRPAWQVAVAAIAAGPIAIVCNLVRILTWGVVTIYARSEPTSLLPRSLATVISLLTAYALFALLCRVLSQFVAEADDSEDEPAVTESSDA